MRWIAGIESSVSAPGQNHAFHNLGTLGNSSEKKNLPREFVSRTPSRRVRLNEAPAS
jgi:hypothetical protein